jgi:carbohydrate kinase (thermoresistant glucokinase family)
MRRFVVMGVAGCGKSTVAQALAERLGLPMIEGDALHPRANIESMRAGRPLTDADRWPWLDAVGAALAAAPGGAVATCSALKRRYRDRLRAAAGDVTFIHLAGERDLIAVRMAARAGHFMPLSLLDSQFAALEPPGPDERAVSVDIAAPPGAVLPMILDRLEGAPT